MLLLGVAVRPLVEDGVVALVRAEVDVDEGEQRARPGVGGLSQLMRQAPSPWKAEATARWTTSSSTGSRPGPVRVD